VLAARMPGGGVRQVSARCRSPSDGEIEQCCRRLVFGDIITAVNGKRTK
jgi:hypothetical protein